MTEKKNPHVVFCKLSKDLSDAPDVQKTRPEFSFDSKAEEQVKVKPTLSFHICSTFVSLEALKPPPTPPSASFPPADLSQHKAQPFASAEFKNH